MKGLALTAWKTTLIWGALLGGSIIGSALAPVAAQPTGDGPLSSGHAFLLVAAVHALVLAWLGSRLFGPFWRRALILFVLLYGVGTALSLVEALFFAEFLQLSDAMVAAIAAMDAVRAAAGAAAAAALWPSRPGAARPPVRHWPIVLIALLYVLVYVAAGFLIAWQSEAVRAFYGEGAGITAVQLLALQVARGFVWGVLAALLVRNAAASAAERALMTGSAFSAFMAATLLYPSAMMPWAVRQVHLVEVGVSNFLFGLAAAAILSAAARPEARRRRLATPRAAAL